MLLKINCSNILNTLFINETVVNLNTRALVTFNKKKKNTQLIELPELILTFIQSFDIVFSERRMKNETKHILFLDGFNSFSA